MTLLVVGLQERSTDLDLFGRTTLAADALPKVLHALVDCDDIREAVVLSTCLRTEFYLEVDRYHAALAQVRDLIALYTGLPSEVVGDHLYSFYDDAAARHLFEVAAGLDSAVLGEGEILHQVREAWNAAVGAQTVRRSLGGALRHAVEVGKRVRTETAIARGTTSIAEAAVDLTQAHQVDLTSEILVVGAGEMAAGVVRALTHRGATQVLIANRTPERAVTLAATYGCSVVGFADLVPTARRVACVLSATSAPAPLLHADDFDGRNALQPCLVLDAGVPRDVDPAVAESAAVTLLSIDDVRQHAERGRNARTAEADAARCIVDQECARFADDQRRRLAGPIVTALRQRADDIRTSELERFSSGHSDMTPEQRRAVDALTSGIVNKLLHSPTAQLNAQAGTEEGDRLAAVLEEAFGLSE